MPEYINLYHKNILKVCKHISINGELIKEGSVYFHDCEYYQDLKIFCKQCKKEFKLRIGVN